MAEVDEKDVRRMAQTARRAELEHPSEVAGGCRDVSVQLVKQLRKNFGVKCSVREVAVGEPRQTHFVVSIDRADWACDGDDGRVLVDPTIQQFSVETKRACPDVLVALGFQENLPETAIYHPGDEERVIWYYQPNCPQWTDETDVWNTDIPASTTSSVRGQE